MTKTRFSRALAILAVVVPLAGPAVAQQPTPDIAAYKPQPTVPEVFNIMGQFVRVAYNNEGYVTLGYRIANGSVGEEWMYLQAGLTLREGVKYQTVKREKGKVAAGALRQSLEDKGLLADRPAGSAEYSVSDAPDNFCATADLFLGRYKGGDVHQISIDQYPARGD